MFALIKSDNFKLWHTRVKHDFIITKITMLAVSRFGKNVSFAYISTNAKRAFDGAKVPGLMFICGDSVAVLISAQVE